MDKILLYLCHLMIVGVCALPRPSVDPISNTTTGCGGVLSGSQGLIAYKVGELYENYARCHWTVRVPHSSAIKFTLSPTSIGTFDHITFHSATWAGLAQELDVTTNSSLPTTFVVNSSIALVSFHSYGETSQNGFSVAFEAVSSDYDDSIKYHYDMNVVATEYWQGLGYSEKNSELSTFVVTRPTGRNTHAISLNITFLQLETDLNGECKDKLYMYYTTKFSHIFSPISWKNGLCDMSELRPLTRYTDSVILVLATDGEGTSRGFQVEWQRSNTSLLPSQ